MSHTHRQRREHIVPSWWALVPLCVGAATMACIFIGRPDAATFLPMYLVGWLFWLGISLGSLALVMIHNLTGGAWGTAIRRILESAAAALPVMLLLAIPLAARLEDVYVWARPGALTADPALAAKAGYLNVESFIVRAIVYFALWFGLTSILNRWSAAREPARQAAGRRRQQALSGPGLILYGLTATFSAIDWGMSIDPHWYSAMYGVLFMAGQALSAMALATLLVAATGPAEADDRQDLGNLLLAMVMFWTYIAFMQYLIIWSANLPEEVPWYLVRSAGVWRMIALGIIAFHFVAPFLLLLSRDIKRNRRWLGAVAGLLLFARLVDMGWLILPSLLPEGYVLRPLDALGPVAIGGFWLTVFFWQWSRRSRLPRYDLSLEIVDERRAQLA